MRVIDVTALQESFITYKCIDKTFPKSRFTQFSYFEKMEMFIVYI